MATPAQQHLDAFELSSASPILQRMAADSARAETLSIRIRFENVYGRLTCYPIDTPAKLFAELAGTKTLTPRACALAQRLGFSLQVDNLSGELLCQFLKEA